MILGRVLTMSSAVALMTILLFSLCTVTSSLPYRLNSGHKDSEEDNKPLYKPSTPRQRLGRATSENVLPATTTTSQLPSPPAGGEEEEEEVEGSGVPTTETVPRCDEASRQQRGCRNLKEALVEYFRQTSLASFDLPLDTFYNSFVMEDLQYFNLLGNGSMEEDPVTQATRDFGERQCSRILSRYSLRNASSGTCSWHYVCDFDIRRFPRFRVEAEIDNHRYLEIGFCTPVQMEATFFERQPCPGDACERGHWVPRPNQHIRVGYEDSSS